MTASGRQASKSGGTRGRILETALALFNDHGLHSVGVRDIARALEMSPGNLQYHFAKKDDLVAALVTALHGANNARIAEVEPADVSFETVFELTLAAFRRHIAYRGVVLSYAEVVSKSPELLAFAKEMDAIRPARMRRFVDLLAVNGYLDRKRVMGRISLIRELSESLGRFWLLHAVLRGEDDLESAAERHARTQLVLWEPYATERGRAQIAKIMGAR